MAGARPTLHGLRTTGYQAARRLGTGLPEPIARLAGRTPFEWRIGGSLARWRAEIRRFDALSEQQRGDELSGRFGRAVRNAYENCDAYRRIYDQAGLDVTTVRGLEDLDRVPIVGKEDLRDAVVLRRPGARLLSARTALVRTSTSGTSSSPISFLVSADDLGREWAHLQAMWRTVGYRWGATTLAFSGKRVSRAVQYNAVLNEYLVDPFVDRKTRVAEVGRLLARRRIDFVRGYPSFIAEFCEEAADTDPAVLESLRRTVRAVMLASEAPLPHYRSRIESSLAPCLSHYGHSEKAIIGWERSRPDEYVPFESYGLAEVVGSGREGRLVGTSWGVLGTPFVRYDTGDRGEGDVAGHGRLSAFRVTLGRFGDYIVDAKGDRVSVTSSLAAASREMGRSVEHVQVEQPAPGQLVVWVVLRRGTTACLDEVTRMFDFGALDADVSVRFTDAPIRSPRGKLLLRVGNSRSPALGPDKPAP